MARENHAQVHGKGGWQGWLEQPFDTGREAQVRLEDGTVLVVPADWLEARENGSYFVPLERSALDRQAVAQDRESTVLPVIEERVQVEKHRTVTGGVRVHKTVREREEVFSPELLQESVKVERVVVDRFVDAPTSPRQEGNTLVIPLFEEVLVVEKRLRLKEEVRITKTSRIEQHPQAVTLREEDVSIEPLAGEGAGAETGNVVPPT